MQLLIKFFSKQYIQEIVIGSTIYNIYKVLQLLLARVTHDFLYLPPKRKDIDSVIVLLLLFFQLNYLSTF